MQKDDFVFCDVKFGINRRCYEWRDVSPHVQSVDPKNTDTAGASASQGHSSTRGGGALTGNKKVRPCGVIIAAQNITDNDKEDICTSVNLGNPLILLAMCKQPAVKRKSSRKGRHRAREIKHHPVASAMSGWPRGRRGAGEKGTPFFVSSMLIKATAQADSEGGFG